MCKFKIYLLLLALSFNFLSIVKSGCILNYPKNIEAVPRYEKHIGKYRLQIPYNGDKIQLQNDETISGFCDTQFRKGEVSGWHKEYFSTDVFVKNKTSIKLTCESNELYFETNLIPETTFECEEINWSIYGTNESYSWCEKNLNSTTFLLATKSTSKPHILAGICYNLEQLSLQTVNYNVSYITTNDMKLHMDIGKSNLRSDKTLTDDLLSFKTTKISELSKLVLQQQLNELGKTNLWLNLASYDVSSIIQDDSYGNYFKEYENVLNIIWWQNLRLGNWKRFMNTLENYAFNNSFELYTGTSDMVRFPTELKCEQDNLLEIKFGFKNETVPAYIWTYLKSNDNLNRDFVIIGYNSPYAEIFVQKFLFAGIMFCCSTDFIRQTNHLNGFPMDVLLSRHLQTNTEIEVTTEIELKTENALMWDNKSKRLNYTSETETETVIFPLLE